MFHIVRTFFWALLFPLSVVLLGLTGYRIHHTKHLSQGDALSNRTHYYDPIIVELLVTSVLALLFCLWFIPAILGKLRNPMSKYITEHISLFIIWVMFLVGAAITTHKWLHLKECRKHYKECRILETIKAFAWMCFIVTTFLILFSLINMFRNKSRVTDPLHGQDEYGAYPETRQTRTTNTTTTAYTNPQPANVVHAESGGVTGGAGTGVGTGTGITAGTKGPARVPAPHGIVNGTTNIRTEEV